MGCNMCVVQKPEEQHRVMLQDYFDPTDLGEPERPEELEYEEVELYKTSHKLGITVCYRTDGEEDPGIYVGEVNPNSIAAKDGRIREGDRIIQINGVEIQDREEAVAFLTREQQTNISLLLARPESQRWKDSDREDFLDEFGSDEEGELRGAWTPPGQPPSPATPGGRGAEPDSGVGRTDESTRNEESSEHDLLAEEAGEAPPPPPRPPPPRRDPQNPPRLHGKPGAGSAPARNGSGCGSAGRAGSGSGGRRGAGSEPGLGSGLGMGIGPGLGPGLGPGIGPGIGPGMGPGLGPGIGPGFAPGFPGSPSPPLPALSPAELRRYRALRGRCAVGAAGRAELARLEEELRHLEFKCRHLLRAQQLERLRERGRRAWRDPRPGVEGPLADIAEAPERDSTSAYNTGESSRSSPLLLRGALGAAPPGPPGPPGGGKGPRGKRPGRDRLLKARAIKILEERGGSTDDDARSELKTGRYWSREQRKQHLARAREQRRRRELLLQARPDGAGGLGGLGGPGGAAGGAGSAAEQQHGGQGSRRGLRKRSRRILDNWVTIQEMMLAHGGRSEHPLLSVTTV